MSVILVGIMGLLFAGFGVWAVYKGIKVGGMVKRGEAVQPYPANWASAVVLGVMAFIAGLLIFGGTTYYVCTGVMPF